MNISTFRFLVVATLLAIFLIPNYALAVPNYALNDGRTTGRTAEMEMDWEDNYSKNYRREKQVMRKKNDLWYGLKKQMHCPITQRRLTDGEKQPYVNYKGYRIYFSSEAVIWIFHKYPKRALRRIYDNGEQPLKLDLCQFCGQIKNTYKCCRDRDTTRICNDCGKHLDSPGHCVPYGLIIPVPKPGENR